MFFVTSGPTDCGAKPSLSQGIVLVALGMAQGVQGMTRGFTPAPQVMPYLLGCTPPAPNVKAETDDRNPISLTRHKIT